MADSLYDKLQQSNTGATFNLYYDSLTTTWSENALANGINVTLMHIGFTTKGEAKFLTLTSITNGTTGRISAEYDKCENTNISDASFIVRLPLREEYTLAAGSNSLLLGIDECWLRTYVDGTHRDAIGGGSNAIVTNKLSTDTACVKLVLILTNRKSVSQPTPPASRISNDLKNIQVGQGFPCRYVVAAAGNLGTYTDFNSITPGSYLPSTPSDLPDGFFLFIFVGWSADGGKKFIADRVLQSKIQWETIKEYVGRGIPFKPVGCAYYASIRIPQGRYDLPCYTDTDDYDEWGADVVMNNRGILKANDPDIWHHDAAASFLAGWQTKNNINGDKFLFYNMRIHSGYLGDVSRTRPTRQGKLAYDDMHPTIGFRPLITIYTEAVSAIDWPECKLPLNSSINLLKPGQAISCSYTCNAGTVGSFSELGVSNKTVICDPAPDAVDGKFYFIHVGYTPDGRNKLVADRNVQCAIKWEELCAQGVNTSTGFDAEALTGVPGSLIRLLTSYKNNKSMPIAESEWDCIIMNRSGKIGATVQSLGTNFNTSKSRSWTATGAEVTDDMATGWYMRAIARGYEAMDYSSIQKSNFPIDQTYSTIGFRPVLIVPAPKNTAIPNAVISCIESMNGDQSLQINVTPVSTAVISSDTSLHVQLNDTDIFPMTNVAGTPSQTIILPNDLIIPKANKLDITLYADGVANRFEYTLTREDILDELRVRDLSSYAGGYNAITNGATLRVCTQATTIDTTRTSGIQAIRPLGADTYFLFSWDGTQWYTFDSATWVLTDMNDIVAKGISDKTLPSITAAQWSTFFQKGHLHFMSMTAATGKLTSLEVQFIPNLPPIISNVVLPASVHKGIMSATLDVTDLEDDDVAVQCSVNGVDTGVMVAAKASDGFPQTVTLKIDTSTFLMGDNTLIFTATDSRGKSSTVTQKLKRNNVMPSILGAIAGSTFTGVVSDAEMDRVSYQISVNGQLRIPWSVLYDTPCNINYMVRREDALFNKSNTVKVEFKDEFGAQSSMQYTFIGSYSGLLFADELGTFYSSDLKVILQRLHLGTWVAGQVGLPTPVRIYNTTGKNLKNVRIWLSDEIPLPPGVQISLSHDQPVFEDLKSIELPGVLLNGAFDTFQVRVSSTIDASSGGDFKILARGIPI